jgi:tetratricopeptide (TPR) repeat protein
MVYFYRVFKQSPLMRTDLLKEYIREDPHDPFLRYALALEYLRSGEDGEALEEFLYVQRQFGDYLPNYYQLGSLLIKMERTVEGLDALKRGLVVAGEQGDMHTASELRALIEEYSPEKP